MKQVRQRLDVACRSCGSNAWKSCGSNTQQGQGDGWLCIICEQDWRSVKEAINTISDEPVRPVVAHPSRTAIEVTAMLVDLVQSHPRGVVPDFYGTAQKVQAILDDNGGVPKRE